jgi:hypothetical protein
MTYHTELAVIINISTKVATQGNLRKKPSKPSKSKEEKQERGACAS